MFGTFVLIILSGVGIYFLVGQIFLCIRTYTFPTTHGTVIKTKIKGELGSKRFHFIPDITYEYTANGQKYTSNQYRIAPELIWKRRVKKIIFGYHTGQTVEVYYDPSKPSFSVLKRGMYPEKFAAGIVMIILLLIAVIERLFF